MTSAATYFHTLRYLRWQQVAGRVRMRLWRPEPDARAAPPRRALHAAWTAPATRAPSLTGPAEASFLSVARSIAGAPAWQDASADKLWQYNLHYFDDLNALGADSRRAWHDALMRRWVAENPPARGVGWDPYPTSLRVVNWVRWAMRGNPLAPALLHSLGVQARHVERRLEFHLLGNHLFSNAKALLFAGSLFGGDEATRWLHVGGRILREQLDEQILADGGQFERSPMYHALALEDVLDLLHLAQIAGNAWPAGLAGLAGRLQEVAPRMLAWLATMSHPDGEIALFNDAAIGIAPAPRQLFAYAAALGLARPAAPIDGITHLRDSGYLRVQQADLVAFVDAGPIGPDYLPGHAHADTLSFELSVGEQRIVVDSGTSCYGEGPERLRQRGTAAHNTVEVDGRDSSEVWAGFRVARRARVTALEVAERPGLWTIRASHDGYRRLPGRVLHTRCWQFAPRAMRVDDTLTGAYSSARARLHLHPAVRVQRECASRASLVVGERAAADIEVTHGTMSIVGGSYHPRFGVSEPGSVVDVGVVEARAGVRVELPA